MRRGLKASIIFITTCFFITTLQSDSGNEIEARPTTTPPADTTRCITPQVLTHIKIPNLENTYHLLDECEVNPYLVYRTMFVFYEAWLLWFDDEGGQVRESINNVLVEWGDKDRRTPAAYNIHGEYITNVLVNGLALSPGHIWVRRDSKSIGNSSLVHEMVHIALWNKYGDADPSHEGGEDTIWTTEHTDFIREVDRILFLMGDAVLSNPLHTDDEIRMIMENHMMGDRIVVK